VTAADAGALAVAAHTLKGSLRALGATRAAALADGLEAFGRAGADLTDAPRLLGSLRPEMARLLSAAAEASSAGPQ
jgi:HPt (histidine-containing phosphotransfer) domain-containing protein